MKKLDNLSDILNFLNKTKKTHLLVFFTSFLIFQIYSYLLPSKSYLVEYTLFNDKTSQNNISLFEVSNSDYIQEIFLFSLSSESTAKILLENNEFQSFRNQKISFLSRISKLLNQKFTTTTDQEILTQFLENNVSYELRESFIIVKLNAGRTDIKKLLGLIISVAESQTRDALTVFYENKVQNYKNLIDNAESIESQRLYISMFNNALDKLLKVNDYNQDIFLRVEESDLKIRSDVLMDSLFFSLLIMLLSVVYAYYKD